MDFRVSYTHLSDEVVVVSVAGEVDVYRAPRLREALNGRIGHGSSLVLVDLRQTTALDATGLGVLVGCLKRVRARRGALVVVTQQDCVLRQFRSTGLTRVLPVSPTVAQALAELTRIRPGLVLRPLDSGSDDESAQVSQGLLG